MFSCNSLVQLTWIQGNVRFTSSLLWNKTYNANSLTIELRRNIQIDESVENTDCNDSKPNSINNRLFTKLVISSVLNRNTAERPAKSNKPGRWETPWFISPDLFGSGSSPKRGTRCRPKALNLRASTCTEMYRAMDDSCLWLCSYKRFLSVFYCLSDETRS